MLAQASAIEKKCYFRTMGPRIETWRELGARVTEARQKACLSQAELAVEMHLDRTAITKIETGERKLDSLELTRLAEILKRPIDWFVTSPAQTVLSRRKARDVPNESQSDALLESLARDVTLLTELGLLKPSPSIRIKKVESVSSAERAARELRKKLGLTAGPSWNLQALAERVGLFAFSLDLPEDRPEPVHPLDGSYLRLERGGVAVVNGRQTTPRRRFTLVHELGHHLFKDDFSTEWIVGPDGEEREKLINAFAIHFLMPRESILPRWQELVGQKQTRRTAIVLGAEYGVSWTAVLAQLCNLELIDGSMRERLTSDRPTKADYTEAGVTLREDFAPNSIPPQFAQAVMRAFKSHKVGSTRALELLRGTFRADELPAHDQVPLESMRAQFDLE